MTMSEVPPKAQQQQPSANLPPSPRPAQITPPAGSFSRFFTSGRFYFFAGFAVFAALNYGWYRLQFNENFVPKEQRRAYPFVEMYQVLSARWRGDPDQRQFKPFPFRARVLVEKERRLEQEAGAKNKQPVD